jgi:hypothetical protein
VKTPEITLSFQKLASAQILATVIGGVGWSIGAKVGGYDWDSAWSGLAVAGILLVVSLLSLYLFSPSKQRPIATVATLWSATSFVRFIAALGASSLLYYVAQFGLRPLMFSFLLTAVFLLVAETKVISKMLSEYSPTTSD